mgnify:FL=1
MFILLFLLSPMNFKQPPDPREIDWLLHEAEQEEEELDLSEYSDVIETLREKGFSWRKIADWLNKRNVPVTHNQLYYYAVKSQAQESDEEDPWESNPNNPDYEANKRTKKSPLDDLE